MDNTYISPWLPYDEQLKKDVNEANQRLLKENQEMKYFDKFWNK